MTAAVKVEWGLLTWRSRIVCALYKQTFLDYLCKHLYIIRIYNILIIIRYNAHPPTHM